MQQRFTEHARKSILAAQQEAVARGQQLVGTGHLLLGLLHPNYLSCEALLAMDVSPEVLRAAIASRLGSAASPPNGEPKLTHQAKFVLDLAAREARRMRNNHIGPEHLLLGLLHSKPFFLKLKSNLARDVLNQHGVGLETTRLVIAQLLAAPLSSSAEPFAEPVQLVIARAQREAEKTGAARIGTVHLLLGLLGEDQLDAQTGSGTLRDLLRRADENPSDDDADWEELRLSLRARLVADGELRSHKTKFTSGAQRALKLSPPESVGGGAMQITVKSLVSGLERHAHPPYAISVGQKIGLPLWKITANDATREMFEEMFGSQGKVARLQRPKNANWWKPRVPASPLSGLDDRTCRPWLNIFAFLIAPVFWLPCFAIMDRPRSTWSVVGLIPFLLVPVIGGLAVVPIMLFSKSMKWKEAGMSLVLGIFIVCLLFPLLHN